MASVTVERIEAVRIHIAAAVTQTSSSSTLSEQEQNKLLAQSCAEACDLIEDWLDTPWWKSVGRHSDGPIEELPPGHQDLVGFLNETLNDALCKADQEGVRFSPLLVEKSRQAVANIAGYHRRKRRLQLYTDAKTNLSELRQEVCDLACQLRNHASNAETRNRAIRKLIKASGIMLSLAIAMAGVGPHQASQNISEWEHEAVKVVMFYHIFDDIPAEVTIRPPEVTNRPAEPIQELTPSKALAEKLEEAKKARNRPASRPQPKDGINPTG